MQCIKTGFHAHLDPYNEYVYGDAFEANGVLILRICQRSFSPLASSIHFTVLNADHWFDQDTANSTLIVMPLGYQSHGYEGQDISGAEGRQA